jgi:hypothetical protein
MGSLQAIEFASAVKDGSTTLRNALNWHLTANHWPALPSEYVDVLHDVVNRVNSGELFTDETVLLPSTLRITPTQATENEDGSFTIRVEDLLDATNTWFFLED